MTDTTFRLFAAERMTRSCSICGQQARPGAKLCPACKAALKRARQETVSELEPLPRRSRARSESVRRENARKSAPVPAKPLPAPERRFRHRDVVTVGVCMAVLALVVYVEAPGWRSRGGPPPEPAAAAAVATPARAPVPVDATAFELRPPVLEPSVRTADNLERVTPETGRPAKPATKRAVPEPPPGSPPAPDAAAAAVPSPVAEAQPTVPAPDPAPTSPPREMPRPDRWQVLQETIARCGREGFLGGFVCEQKARLVACDGQWGQVPQCPSGIANDHGQ